MGSLCVVPKPTSFSAEQSQEKEYIEIRLYVEKCDIF